MPKTPPIRTFHYQRLNANQGGFLEEFVLHHGPSFGVRFDFNDSDGFKTQLDHTMRKASPTSACICSWHTHFEPGQTCTLN
jgi:hypothetical protein